MTPIGGHDTDVFALAAPDAPGTYGWRYFMPCGDGSNGTGGAMQAPGWM